MSLNLENISIKMTDELDKAVVQKPVTGFLADNNLRGKFVGAKTVMIPEMNISGLGDYDRDTGFVSGTVSVSAKPFTLTMDRGRSFQLDREDYDESGIANLAGQIMGEFVRTQVVPELDAYVLSKLAGVAVNETNTITGTPETDAFAMLTEAIAKVQNVVGYDEELVAFVDGAMLNALQNSEEVSRHLVMNDFSKGELHTKVNSLNGVAILPVPDSRMKTAYNFYDGVTSGQENGGFVPAENASSIGLLVMPRRAASLIKKTEQVRCFDPSHNQKADAWKLDYRLYYDVVLKDSMQDGIYAYVY
ncbi:MAG: hypothetical protein II363_03745 [Clostridia bacterium]|nr:hypothetical protein [Clostridia bacterium]